MIDLSPIEFKLLRSMLMLALLADGAWFVVRIGQRPLTDMEELATAIPADNLSSRVAESDPHTGPTSWASRSNRCSPGSRP